MNKLEDSPLCQSHHNLHAQRRKKLTWPQTYQNNKKIYFTSKNNFKSGQQALLSTTFNNPCFSLPGWLSVADFALPPLCLCAHPLKSVSLGFTEEDSIWRRGSFTFFKLFIIVITISVTVPFPSPEKKQPSFPHLGNPYPVLMCVTYVLKKGIRLFSCLLGLRVFLENLKLP